MSNIIEFRHVSKQYKTGEIITHALRNVSFEVTAGEFVIILGASGAGKSTILNLLGGMDCVTAGSIMVDGADITRLGADRLADFRRDKIGFVFQFYNLIANMNALENVQFAAESCKNHLDAREVMAEVGLAERVSNFPSQLSGGEQQRVAIARAVTKNPLLLLCDEPTGALDYVTGKQVLKLLEHVNGRFGKTVVIVTHNAALAEMGDKVIRVKSGAIESVTQNARKRPIDEIEW